MTLQLAPCGLDCVHCPVFIATQNDDSAARIKLADAFKAQFGKEVDPETVRCCGCLGEGTPLHFCSICQIRACALGKSYATCAECAEYPCPKGKHIWDSSPWATEALDKLRSERA